jgi:hypothetical protein
VIKEVISYEAPDGMLFNTPEECKRYEEALEQDLEYLQERFKADGLRPEEDGEFIPLSMFLRNGGSFPKCSKLMKEEPMDFYVLGSLDDAELVSRVIASEYSGTAEPDPEFIMKKMRSLAFPCTVAFAPWYGSGREPISDKKTIDMVKKWAKLRGYKADFVPVDETGEPKKRTRKKAKKDEKPE